MTDLPPPPCGPNRPPSMPSRLPDIDELAAKLDQADTGKQKLDATLAIAYGLWEIEAWQAATPFEAGDKYMMITAANGIDTAEGLHYCNGETIRVTAADRKRLIEAGQARDIIGGILPTDFVPMPKGKNR